MPSTLTLSPAVRVKLAAGDVQTFENSLATIGRSFLSPKSPALFQHEIGFQVLDQDDDNTRAVGVFGFRIGDRLFYVPMFYRNGTVKGTEQLRDPKRKRTVPLTDNWVNKLLSERGDDPPQRVSRANSQSASLPSLWQLKFPPSKYASERPAEWRQFLTDVRVDLARVIAGPPRRPADAGLDLIKIAGENPALLSLVGRMTADYAWFGDALKRYHGGEKVAAALAAADRPPPKSRPAVLGGGSLVRPTPKAAASVTVIRIRAVDLGRGRGLGGLDFSPADLDELKAGRNAYTDKRPDKDVGTVTAWVGGRTDTRETLSNPLDSGFYEVLGLDHDYHPAVVLVNLVGWKPEAAGKVLVIRPADNAWVLAHRNNVWVRGEDGGINPDRESGDHGKLHAWAEKLETVKDELPTGQSAAVVLRSPGKVVATVPFDRWGGDDNCHPMVCPNSPAPYWAPHDPRTVRDQPYVDSRGDSGYGPRRVAVFPDPGHGLPVVSGRQLYLPPTAKLVKLDGPRFPLGDGTDPERALFMTRKKAGELAVGVSRTTGGWRVDGPGGRPAKTAHIEDAEALLVLGHGIRPADARKLVGLAAGAADKTATAYVKYAAGGQYGLAHNAPNSPHMEFDQLGVPASFADDIMPTQSAASTGIPIQDMLAQPGAPDKYRPYPQDYGTLRGLPGIGNGAEPPQAGPTAGDLRAVSDAASSGKRELFDTAALAALVKYTRLPSLLERIRTRTARTVTDLADLLAHMYWNTDEWSDQYGQTEVGPLEDQIRSQFEGLGDLILTLQEKAVESDVDTGVLPEPEPTDGGDGR